MPSIVVNQSVLVQYELELDSISQPNNINPVGGRYVHVSHHHSVGENIHFTPSMYMDVLSTYWYILERKTMYQVHTDFVTVTEDDFVQFKLLFKYKRVELFGL